MLLLSIVVITLFLGLWTGSVSALVAVEEHHHPLYVLVAGPPRMGTTWLFNAVRLLVRHTDPNVISSFETSVQNRDLCYWRSRNVSMVVKTHALHKPFMLGANCASSKSLQTGSEKIMKDDFQPGFEMVVTSFRDPFATACSLVKKDGRVQKDMCEKVLCEQHAFYHPPTSLPVLPRVVYEMDFRDLTSGLEVEILRELAVALGLFTDLAVPSAGIDAEAVLRLLANELAHLKPLGDPVHSLRSAQHPVTLMHSNHVGVADQSACEHDPGIAAMQKNSMCHEWAELHGRQSESLWEKYNDQWRGHCVKMRKIPSPTTKLRQEL